MNPHVFLIKQAMTMIPGRVTERVPGWMAEAGGLLAGAGLPGVSEATRLAAKRLHNVRGDDLAELTRYALSRELGTATKPLSRHLADMTPDDISRAIEIGALTSDDVVALERLGMLGTGVATVGAGKALEGVGAGLKGLHNLVSDKVKAYQDRFGQKEGTPTA